MLVAFCFPQLDNHNKNYLVFLRLFHFKRLFRLNFLFTLAKINISLFNCSAGIHIPVR